MCDSMRRSRSLIFSETIKWSYWCECELMQSSTTSDGTFTRRDTLYSHENCRDFQIEIILFGDQHFLIRMKFGICFRRTLHSFQTLCCVCFEYTAFVLNTLLQSFRTHYCVPLEHTTAFDSIRNERSAFASKRRRTHQDVNTNACECRVRSFPTQLCFFSCF